MTTRNPVCWKILKTEKLLKFVPFSEMGEPQKGNETCNASLLARISTSCQHAPAPILTLV